MTPSEFYKQNRPDFFSDTEFIQQAELPREYLAYELDKISTNQKQDEFETLCRRLAEKLISPNLIPQVGPTGGGDGKTDSETYPVSEEISIRWFTPENGWDKDENWAFAISAKAEWKGKAKADIKKIVETQRGYTRVYFMSNQLIPSKKKKDAQDEFQNEFDIDVVILDGEWILENIYSNNFINLVVDSLNLSAVYKQETKYGANDIERLQRLDEIEENIKRTTRYTEYDFQLVEDALQSAILSRMLEKPRDEVEGKFDRALRFCKKNGNKRQYMRIYYQRAWTDINWYDDYNSFCDNYKNFKDYIVEEISISEIEEYVTLFITLYSLVQFDKEVLELINFDEEKKDIINILTKASGNTVKTTLSLVAKTNLILLKLVNKENVDDSLNSLIEILLRSKKQIDYPFDSIRKIIEVMLSKIFINNEIFDSLIDTLALISSERSSELESGQIFLNRAIEKLEAKYYKESIVYFGKCIYKLAKEETYEHMFFSFVGLAISYKKLGLIWASNNCYVLACNFSFKLLDEKGTPSVKTYNVIKELLSNEIQVGRIPYILTWHEMFLIFHKLLQIDNSKEELPFISLCDGTLSTRLMHTDNTIEDIFKYLPEILEKHELYFSESTVLYKQGYIDKILEENKNYSNESEIDETFYHVANQPFVKQMYHKTDFLEKQELSISSSILGCKFILKFTQDIEMMLIAETLLAFFESFLGTSLSQISSHKEKIVINIYKSNEEKINYIYDDNLNEYNLSVNNLDYIGENYDLIMTFFIDLVIKNFMVIDYEKQFKKLYKDESVNERVSFIFGYINAMKNILGDKPKLLFDDWINYCNIVTKYPCQRKEAINIEYDQKLFEGKQDKLEKDLNKISHDKLRTHTVIDILTWDKAKWKGFGFTFDPQDGMGIFLAFENKSNAIKIFEDWKKNIGNIDKKELIKVVIIKGIDKHNPYWYKVVIIINENAIDISEENFMIMPSRIHTMTPQNPNNLNNLIQTFKHLKKYKLFPAVISPKREVEPLFEKGIQKTEIKIIEAWKIGKNDLECCAIKKGDNPIIPKEHEKNAPILEIVSNK